MPQISIIVPVYKVEPYLHRCVDSILAQTFTDFELILVDDGSPDNCPAICDGYAAKDARIHVIHQENRGQSAARNAGIEKAQGRYLMFCDSDDYVIPTWFEIMYNEIKNHPAAWVVCNIYKISKEQPPIPKVNQKYISDNTVLDYFQIFKLGLSGYVFNKIYQRQMVEQYQLRFDENCRFAEDVLFTVQYCMHCNEIRYVSQPLYYYWNNSDSIMHTYRRNLFELHCGPFYCRLPLIEEKYLPEYCDIWYVYFYQMLSVVFDQRNHESFINKMRYNQKMINTPEFVFCLSHMSGHRENALQLKILKTKNYYLLWLFQQVIEIKHKLRGK